MNMHAAPRAECESSLQLHYQRESIMPHYEGHGGGVQFFSPHGALAACARES